jgi:cytosine deaminase
MTPENNNCYWLKNAHIPTCLLVNDSSHNNSREGLSLWDIEVTEGMITNITAPSPDIVGKDLKKGIVLPCFIDAHTHLDKGHIWERSPNPNCTFNNALTTVKKDVRFWSEEDVYRRMEFGLKCSYAQGTIAIRTHIDSFGSQGELGLNIFKALREKWAEQLILQAVSLVTLDYYQTPEGVALADKIAEIGGTLGGVAYTNPQLEGQLDTIFSLAKERNLNLDFHADENGEIDSVCLQKIAQGAIRHQFTGKIICGHCCSLAIQSPEVVKKTLELVKEAGIGIISLPMCNLYLQDRKANNTPFWRGTTKVHELKNQGIPVVFASDNCRDPFFGFGDHDMLEVFNQAVRIAHLDSPYGDWIASVTRKAAEIMDLPQLGRIEIGLPANLILFKARYFSELLSRSQGDRIILRQGQQIDTTLPAYEELDDLLDI